ncbi:MAG: deoxynucleoside kinase [Burkholderiales bacterium]
MTLAQHRFIAIEGPIGAGKTTLARRLAGRLGGEPLLEDPDANPFLARFYQDRARYALPTQLFFLFQRFEQLRAVAQHDLFARVRVADFLLDKDPLFASLNLSGDELALYERLYAALAPRAPRPDLVIYLHAGPRTLAERVRGRAVEYERALEEDYLARLAEAYARFFHHYDEAPVMAVNSEHLDFAASERDFELLLARVGAMRGRRAYFNVGD